MSRRVLSTRRECRSAGILSRLRNATDLLGFSAMAGSVSPSTAAGSGVDCSIAATLSAIGDRWTLLILRDVFRGVRRFSQLHDDLGIAKNILSDRLQKLVDAQVLEPVQYQDRPARYEYRLTPKGLDLSPALVALMHWGDRWYADDGPPTVLVHDACGTPLEQITRCPTCFEEISPAAIGSRPGPGGDQTSDSQRHQ